MGVSLKKLDTKKYYQAIMSNSIKLQVLAAKPPKLVGQGNTPLLGILSADFFALDATKGMDKL